MQKGYLYQFLAWLVALLGIGAVAFGSEKLHQEVRQELVLQPDGKASIIWVEKVPESALQRLYAEHAMIMEKEPCLRDNYLSDVTQLFSVNLGIEPKMDLQWQGISGSAFERKLYCEVIPLARPYPEDKAVQEIRVKQFADQKLLARYFECVLDARLFQSSYLEMLKGCQEWVSNNTTTFFLPKGVDIKNSKELYGKHWRVDFGGGSVMEALLSVDEREATITLSELITVTESAPNNLLRKENMVLFDQLREYAGFTIRYSLPAGQAKLETPEDKKPSTLDFSKSWEFHISEPLSHEFSHQGLTLKPSINIVANLIAGVEWKHHWVWSGWRTRYSLEKFQTSISLAPSVDASLTVSSITNLEEEWTHEIITKCKTFYFSVSCVPIFIKLEGKLKLKAGAKTEGSISATTGATLSINTSLTMEWQNGWRAWCTKSFTSTFSGFSANARINAMARGEIPFTITAYLYNVAGPFVELVPYVQADSNAQAGGTTEIPFKLVAGINANGGARIAGWLKSLAGDLGEYNKTFYAIGPITIKEGTITLTK